MASRTRGFLITIFPKLEDDFPWDPWTIDWLQHKPAIQYFCCQLEETPSTAKLHWQSYVEYKHPQGVQNVIKSWTFAGKPHIEIRKGTPQQARSYCLKDESCVDHDTRFEFGILRDVAKTKDEIYRAALSCETVDGSLSYIKENAPRDYILNKSSIDRHIRQIFKETEIHLRPVHVFLIPFKSKEILERYSIFLWGQPGTGKTSYALAHFQKPLLVSHIDDLKRITKETDGIVFDDLSFKHYPRTTCIHLLDMEHTRSIHIRYGTAELRAGLPRIFTSNESFTDVFNCTTTGGQHEPIALFRRSKRYRVLSYLGKPELSMCGLQYDARSGAKRDGCTYPMFF